MTAPLRIGVVGLGVISRFYLAAMRQLEEVRLVAVCDRDPRVLEPHRGTVASYLDHRDLLADTDLRLDAVVVNVPNDVHAPVCRDALLAGRAVCVEKPLATTLADAEELVGLARTRGVPLFTAFHRRYNDNLVALRDGLPPGVPVTSLTVRYLERIEDHVGGDRWYLDPRRCGGGCVADNGPNAFDVVRMFLGDVRLAGAEVVRDGGDVDRQATVSLRSASGVPATVELDWAYPGERKDVEVTLADGSVRSADMLAGHPEFKGSLWHEYVGVLRDLVDVVGSGRDRADDGLAALRLVDAVYAAERAAAGVG